MELSNNKDVILCLLADNKKQLSSSLRFGSHMNNNCKTRPSFPLGVACLLYSLSSEMFVLSSGNKDAKGDIRMN
jgi:hypothetical protein